MAVMGRPVGSRSGGRPWTDALTRALKRAALDPASGAVTLDKLAQTVINLAAAGDMMAIREISDRIDGKAVQQIDANVNAAVTIEVVRFSDQQPALIAPVAASQLPRVQDEQDSEG